MVAASGSSGRKEDRKAAADRREATAGASARRIKDAEAEIARLAKSMAEIDAALAGSPPTPALKLMTMGQLMKRRGDVEKLQAAIEAEWMDASEALEGAAVA